MILRQVLTTAIATLIFEAAHGTIPACEEIHNTYKRFTLPKEHDSIEKYLNPKIFQDPETVQSIQQRLRDGHLVVIKNAFLEDYAEAMYDELNTSSDFELQESYDFEDGFHYSHHNIYDLSKYKNLMNTTLSMFNSEATKALCQEWSGRDCSGTSIASSSYYAPGDHSLPHTDHLGQRSVAYVWHLTKNWKPQWGGALYWCREYADSTYIHASFNTLTLFAVTPFTTHFVTTVSPHATEKRLAFNGWWESSWIPSAEDPLETLLDINSSEEEFRKEALQLTFYQYTRLENIAEQCEKDSNFVSPPERCDALIELYDEIDHLFFPEEVMTEIIDV